MGKTERRDSETNGCKCCAQHWEMEWVTALAVQKTDSVLWFWLRFCDFTIFAMVLWFHNIGYGFLSKWSGTGSLVFDN